MYMRNTEQPAQQCTAYAKNKRILTATNAAAQMVNSAIYSRLPAANEETVPNPDTVIDVTSSFEHCLFLSGPQC